MDFLDQIDALDNIYAIENMSPPRKVKTYETGCNPLLLSDDNFKTKYRFSKEYVMKICDIVRDGVEKSNRGVVFSTELQVLITLRTWGRQEVQYDADDLHGVSQQFITNTCRRVA
ncbi:unnamed protein product [Euphydryas editha]|uniref:Uncharacterized protein n=1 Tax=Euphydryas editha TaxID=104508 RepID=A0AAU9TUC1_EUPED|nr:unnamed protein product [Euphydryas editha]